MSALAKAKALLAEKDNYTGGYHLVNHKTNEIISSHPNKAKALIASREVTVPAVIISKSAYVANESDDAHGTAKAMANGK